ncbi:MAG: hypothetical protein SV186_00450 [Candidatus Nanohaloarchaea archaeon]|nr:hypothetical protein [Candidatus Nanohaloarchaea archaeon]
MPASTFTFTLPVLGEMAFQNLTLPAVVIGGLIDSVNPCAMGVLIFLMTYLTKVFDDRSHALIGGLLYTTAVYITYLLSGIGLMAALKQTAPIVFLGIAAAGFILFLLLNKVYSDGSHWVASTVKYFGAAIGGFAVLLAIIASVPQEVASYWFYWVATFIAFSAAAFEIKDFFWYGKGVSMDMSIIPGASERIKMWTNRMEETSASDARLALLLTIPIGFGAAAFELPCTGQVYLAILGMINASGVPIATWVPLLLLYNLIFVAPLLIITALMYVGMSSERLESWRKENRRFMRLGIGLFLYALGGFLLWFTVNQFPNQPTLEPMGFLLFASQVSIIGYIIYKGYLQR